MSMFKQYFIDPLEAFYGSGFTKGFIDSVEPYAKDLNEIGLEEAVNKIKNKHKTKPSLSQCRDALGAVQRIVSARISTDIPKWDNNARDRLRWQRRREAAKLCACEIGRIADREGWLCSLLDFVEDNGRLPETRDEEFIIKARMRRVEDSLERARGTPFFNNLVNWRKNMIDAARRLVFGNDPLDKEHQEVNIY